MVLSLVANIKATGHVLPMVQEWSVGCPKNLGNLSLNGFVDGCSETIHIRLTLMQDTLMAGKSCKGGHIEQVLKK